MEGLALMKMWCRGAEGHGKQAEKMEAGFPFTLQSCPLLSVVLANSVISEWNQRKLSLESDIGF